MILKYRTFFFFLIISFLSTQAVHSLIWEKKYSISGQTMGTFYNVVVYSNKKIIPQNLKQKINVQLKMVNQQMSLYLKTSEISKLNKATKNEVVLISNDFYKVILQAEKIYKLTNGAWDGTVRPIYDLWGFDKTQQLLTKVPDQKTIEKSQSLIGFHNIIINEKSISKKISSLSLDLGSIAKGYGVDAVVNLLKSFHFKNFFVEIGGEVYAAGQKAKKNKWKVGISMPIENYNTDPYKIVNFSDKALATSGTYRNFLRINNKTYSHIINPKTGWPINNTIISVSVIADNCMLADGLATGLMVMEIEKGMALVNSLDNVECMIILGKKSNKIEPHFSRNFEKYCMNIDFHGN